MNNGFRAVPEAGYKTTRAPTGADEWFVSLFIGFRKEKIIRTMRKSYVYWER